MEQLPRLNLGVTLPAARPKYLEPLVPPLIPFTKPAWCMQQKPRSISLLDVFKDHELLTTYTVDQKPYYTIGRNAVICDIVLNHCSISRLHAMIIHHCEGSTYLVDLGSCHGTFVDDIQLKALQPTLIVHGSVLKFGASSRSYSFKSFESKDQILEIVQARIGLEPDELELQQNTMMNRALSYRLGFSIPHTHKTDAEGDALMPSCATRQIEEPSSASGLIRRTQSEDNTIAGAFPVEPHPVASMLLVGDHEPGRKRSRTQSAGLPSATQSSSSSGGGPTGLSSGQNGSVVAPTGVDGDDAAMPKRVHFSERVPESIPDYFAAYTSPPSGEDVENGEMLDAMHDEETSRDGPEDTSRDREDVVIHEDDDDL